MVGSHRTARAAFRLTGLFVVWAIAWAVVRQVAGEGTWWGPLHVFLVGGVLLAISGATQMFSITWAAATPPDRRLAAAQRWVTAAGATSAVMGVSAGVAWLAAIGAGLVAAGLGVLVWILVGITHRSLLHRFGLTARFYLLALAAGLIGVTLGGLLAIKGAGLAHLNVRTAHMHLNLVGLIGFTIFGTLPTLLPTTAHHRMVSGSEGRIAFGLCVGSVAAMVAGIVAGPRLVGAGCALAAVAGVTILVGIVSRLGLRRMLGSGFPGLLIATGTMWIIGWCANQAVVLAQGNHTVYAGATVLGVGGVALVLFGSLAYLIPVLSAAGKTPGDTVPVMHRHGKLRVIGANLVLAAAAFGLPRSILVGVTAVWLIDFGVRVGRVMLVGSRTR